MANVKITQLPELAEAPASGDLFEVVDVSTGLNKKVQAQYVVGGAVDSVNGQTGVVSIDLQSVVEEGRTFTESDGTTQYDIEAFTGSGTSKRFTLKATNLATSLINIFSFGRNYFQAKIVTSATASKEFLMDTVNCYWENLSTSGYNRLRIQSRTVSGNSIFDLPNNRIRSTYNLGLEKEIVIGSTRTAENFMEYIVTKSTVGACVFTDPSTTIGYTVYISEGSAELGGVEYFKGSYIQRYYDGTLSTWVNIDINKSYIPKTTSFTAIIDTPYTANGTLTVTDPTPIANKGYIVHVIGGSVTIGGVAYTSGALVYRYYDGASWISTNMNNAITIDATPTDGSSNAVSSNGVFDALALKANLDRVEQYVISKPVGSYGSVTGTVAETVILSIPFSGGDFEIGDYMGFNIWATKSVIVASTIFVVRVGTTGTTADSILCQLGGHPTGQNTFSATRFYIQFETGNFINNRTRVSTGVNTDITGAVSFTRPSLDPSASWFLTFTVINSSALDVTNISAYQVTKRKSF